MKIRNVFAAIATLLVTAGLIAAIPALASPPIAVDKNDDKVSGQTYVRYDGGTDQAIRDCNNHDPAVFGAPAERPEIAPRASGHDFGVAWRPLGVWPRCDADRLKW